MRLALLLIDLDGLKEVNETLGHYEARGRECPYVANAGAAVDRACPLAGPAMSVPPASGATGRSGSADRPRVAVGRDDKRELRTGRGTRWQLPVRTGGAGADLGLGFDRACPAGHRPRSRSAT